MSGSVMAHMRGTYVFPSRPISSFKISDILWQSNSILKRSSELCMDGLLGWCTKELLIICSLRATPTTLTCVRLRICRGIKRIRVLSPVQRQ